MRINLAYSHPGYDVAICFRSAANYELCFLYDTAGGTLLIIPASTYKYVLAGIAKIVHKTLHKMCKTGAAG